MTDPRDGLIELERLIASASEALGRDERCGIHVVISGPMIGNDMAEAHLSYPPEFLDTLRNAAAALRVALAVRR